jgi:hypothetical protein
VPKGRRPKGQGEHFERNARWYYLARIAMPPMQRSETDLAREYAEARAADGVALQPKDSTGIDRPDTAIVRAGIREAQRLLSLTIPPQQWAEIFEIHA